MKTIAAALAKAMPGDRIVVCEGAYDEAVNLPRSGEEGRPITLSAEGKVVLKAVHQGAKSSGIVGRGVGGWVIEGFEITDAVQGIKFKDGRDIIIRKCRIHDSGDGVSFIGSFARNILVEDVEAFNNKSNGIEVSNPVALENVVFRRCSVHHNDCDDGSDGFGISHKCTTRNVRFEDCLAFENGSDGFDLSGQAGYGITVVNCVSHHNGLRMWGSNFKCWNPGSTFINCVAWSTGKEADPNFTAAADNLTFIHCTSGQNGDAGFGLEGANARLINCISANARKAAVGMRGKTASCRAENCLVSGCGNAGAIVLDKDGNIAGDPKFVDPAKGDYRIKSDSAAAGKGRPRPEVTQDAKGRPRPKDAPAIGAYEPEAATGK